jgi:hypothetical protein
MGDEDAVGKHSCSMTAVFGGGPISITFTASFAASVPCRVCESEWGEVMQRAFMLSVCAVVMTYAFNAAADSPNLKGAYGFTGTGGCLHSTTGFDSNLQALGPSRLGSSAVEGIRTFNGDCTGTVKGTEVQITGTRTPPGGTPPHAESINFSFSFTYTVNGDGSWKTDIVPGTFMGTNVTGPVSGQTFTIANFPTLTGLISQDGKTLTLAGLTPTVETTTRSDGTVRTRICHRSRVLIKLQSGNDDHDH